MSDDIPYVGFSFNGKMEKIGVIGAREYEYLTDMFIDAPFIRDPEHVDLLAKALNHFDQGMDFKLIEDIDAYAEKFRKTYTEEEDQPFDQYKSSISDFSMPDLDEISPPIINEDNITFYVNHAGLGIPYKVTGARDGRSKLTYTPL